MNDRYGAATSGKPVAPARRIAADVLAAVRDDDAYANLLLPARIAQANLSTVDAALATELTYGTLRMQGRYDHIIRIAANREVTAIDPQVLDVLRLGVHQLLATRIPPHAAVGDTVTLAPRKATGFRQRRAAHDRAVDSRRVGCPPRWRASRATRCSPPTIRIRCG